MVLLGLPGLPRTGALHPRTPYVEPLQTPYHRNRLNDCGSCTDYLLILCPGYTRRNAYHPRNRNRMGFLYYQLCDSHCGHVPYVHMHQPPESSADHNRNVETQLRYISYAHLLARTVGNRVQAYSRIAHRCCHTMHCGNHICLLFCIDKDYLVHTGQ